MKRRRKTNAFGLSFLLSFVLVSVITASEEHTNVIVPRTIISSSKNDSSQGLYGRSYIQKFSSSWHIYAKANDIAKREKLKRALRDALYSIENRKKSDISTSIDTDAITRINQAAQLLKEFRQMYSLSENVKRTLHAYKEAKSNLTSIAKTTPGYQMLKRFLVTHSLTDKKRNHIPTTKLSFVDQLIDETDNSIIKNPTLNFEIQKRNLISPYFHHGAAFRHKTFDPTLTGTTSAFKKASVVLNYMKKKYENNPSKVQVISHLIEQLRDDMSKISPTLSNNSRKSYFPTSPTNALKKDVSSTKDDMMESLINDSESDKKSSLITTRRSKPFLPHVVKSYEMKDFPQPAGVRSLLTEKIRDRNINPRMDMKSIQKNPIKNVATQNSFIKNPKKINPFVIALLQKMENKALKRKEINKVGFLSKKENILAFSSNNTVQNKSEHTLSHEEQALLSKEIMDTLNEKDNELINATKGYTMKNNTEKQLSNDSIGITPTSREFQILQEANDANSTNDTKTLRNDTSPIDPLKLAMALDKDEKIQDEILKQLSDLQQEKLSEKIAELQRGISQKKNELLIENATAAADKESAINPNPHPPGDVSMFQKQQDTLRQLREAKLARQKYEVAKHELAQKVKELYIMANEYEKQETSDQILEVKNFITDAREKGFEEYVSSHNVKRDENHPGIALSGIQSHEPEKMSADDDTAHKSFTMGMTDKKQHAIDLDEDKPTESVKKIYDLPKPLKLKDDSSSTKLPLKKSKSQEETLKVIAQAIQEDMEAISGNEKKKKILVASMKPKSFPTVLHLKESKPISRKITESSKKKGLSSVNNIDEYLTKALAEFMGNDTKPSPFDSEKETKEKEDQEERNRKIVENAMRQHAKNPNLPLPLVSTKGDRMELTKGQNDTVNNTYLAVNRTDSDKVDRKPIPNDIFAKLAEHDRLATMTTVGELDPADKLLLDKATHMEEQVAAAQDKLYAADNSPVVDPPVAPQPVVFSPLIKQPVNYEKEVAHHVKPIPSVSVQAIPNDPYETIKEQANTQQPTSASAPLPPSSVAADVPQNHPNGLTSLEALPSPLTSDHSVARAQPAPQPHSPEYDENDEKDEDERDDEDEEDEEERPLYRHRNHRYSYRDRDEDDDENEPEDDEEDDEDDDEEDKKSRVRYKNIADEKRTIGLTIVKGESASLIPHTNETPTSPVADDSPKEELEDSKRMVIPK